MSHMAHQSHGTSITWQEMSVRNFTNTCVRRKKCYQIPECFSEVFTVLRSRLCWNIIIIALLCVYVSGVLCRGPGSSPTSGVVTRGASLASLSVVLLSVSESDSELLSESLELPDPPLVGAAGGGWGVAKSGLKGK